ncbi:MAG: hypothetical protein HZA52_14065 [Planctomycetes bacterium]|nr:hypothetical protein [Planctomycetota bacterium]
MNPTFRLRELPLAFRFGLTGVVGAVLLGLWASLTHLQDHHQNRDARPGVSIDDLVGAYHGIDNPAPFVVALEREHPKEQQAADRKLLLDWLKSDKVSENFDNPDLGPAAPAEIVARDCLQCHSRKSTQGEGIGQTIPLEYWDDIEKVAFSRKLEATPWPILVTSTHTHALAMATLAGVLMILVWSTRFVPFARSMVAFLLGVGLACDLAGWFLARESAALVWLVIGGGSAFAGGAALGCVLVLGELWLPRRGN